MKRLTFIKGWKMYQPGETAGFADDVAKALLSGGLAVDTDAAAAKAEADEAAAKAAADAKAKAEADEAAAKTKAKAG